MEGSDARISYYLAPSDVPEGVKDENALFTILLSRYQEWQEPRIMPVMDADWAK